MPRTDMSHPASARRPSRVAPRPQIGTRLALWSMAAISCGWIAAARAQEPPAQTFEGEVVVSEVLLDAVVTDKQGRVILGLGADDFVVEENGDPVEIAGVSFYSSQERAPSVEVDLPGFDLSDIPEDRYFILFFQEIRSGGLALSRILSRQQQAARAMEEWVVSGLAPADFVAVVSYGYKLKVHQDFTRDRKKILAGIESAARGRDPYEKWPSRQPPDDEVGPLLKNLPTGKPLRKQSGNVYEGLQLLAKAAAAVPGRKNLVFLGVGFDPIRSTEYRRMYPTVRALNDANVAAYTVDLIPTGTEHSLRSSLNNLAIATGGEFYFTFIRFEAALEEIAMTTSGYYLIAYRSEHPAGKSGYQRVDVKTVNPEFKVWARSGYSFGDGG